VAAIHAIANARRQAGRIHRGLGDDLRRLREDAGVNRAALAAAADVDLSYLCRIEEGGERPSIDTYVKLATALGTDLSARLYPNTGPAIRDRHQARILEALVGLLHPRWHPYGEVSVRRPSRGWIDVALHEPRERLLVATEIQSELRRLEQIIRWSAEKADSLPSWEGWTRLGESPMTSRLLVVRSTRATQAVGREFSRQLVSSYPAHPEDALAALRGVTPWPGPALIWIDLQPDGVRFLARR